MSAIPGPYISMLSQKQVNGPEGDDVLENMGEIVSICGNRGFLKWGWGPDGLRGGWGPKGLEAREMGDWRAWFLRNQKAGWGGSPKSLKTDTDRQSDGQKQTSNKRRYYQVPLVSTKHH